MRKFDYITVGTILDELKKEGMPSMNRVSFYRMEKKYKWPQWDKDPRDWRRYTREEAEKIKQLIKEKYKIESKSDAKGFVARFIDALKKT